LIRFGIFEADLQAGELRKQGLRIKLQEQPFQILALLLERSGQLVTRDELREKLWGTDTFVDFDRGLNKAINRLREALADSADNPRFIETVPKRGYRFISPIEHLETTAVLPIPPGTEFHSSPAPAKSSKALGREMLAWALAAVSLSGSIWLFATRSGGNPEPAPLQRSSLLPPPNTSFLPYGFAISPDGKLLTFAAVDDNGRSSLWIQALSASTAQRLEGTDGATFPFWSLDNRHIGFFADRKLKTVEMPGGGVRILCDAPSGHGGAWNRDGTIVFAPSIAGPLYRINAAGGIPAAVTPIRGAAQSHCLPSFLPDGRDFLFYVFRSADADVLQNGVHIGTLGSTQARQLAPDLSGKVIYSSGHLLYVRDRSLVAQPFDLNHLEPAGPFFSIAEQVLESERTFGVAGFTASENGIVVLQSTLDSPVRPTWFDSSGKELGPISDVPSRDPSLSRDGRYLAISSDESRNGKYSIRVYDLARGLSNRLVEAGSAGRPIWAPDGKDIVYQTVDGTVSYLYRVPSDGSAPPRLITKGFYMSPTDWSPDGQYLIYLTVENGLPFLNLYSLVKDSIARFASGAEAQFSPDGKWIAYVGQGGVAGGGGVVIQAFPGPGAHIQISEPGGAQPRWGRDEHRVFFIAPDRKLMSVSFDPKTATASQPRVVFATRIVAPNLVSHQYDVAPDGRFLINSFPSRNSPPLTLMTGWQPAKSAKPRR